MEPFTRGEGVVCPLDRADVDTDQIIPKQFLKRIERTGFGEFLFWDWRGEEGFPLDRPESTWDSAYAARVHDLLFAHFELRDRHEALMHKLASVQSTLEIIIDLWQSRRSLLLEAAIIALFLLEIGLALFGAK